MKFLKIALLMLVMLSLERFARPTQAQVAVKPLTIFAASSLTDVFGEIKPIFEKAHPGVELVYNFGSSSTLATQLVEGAEADLFASANTRQMGLVQDAKRVIDKPALFAKNRLVLIIPRDNPAQIVSIDDLVKPGIKLVIAAPKVPVRDYTDAMLEKLVSQPAYGADYKTAFLKNVVSEESNVRQVSAKVALGEADAGIVYRSDVTPDISDKVSFLPIPDEINTLASYPIAVLDKAPNAETAKQFVEYLTSAMGQRLLKKWNFIPVQDPDATPAPTGTVPATVPAAVSGTMPATQAATTTAR